MSETRRVVRREPEVFNAKQSPVDETWGVEGTIPDEQGLTWFHYDRFEFKKEFIDADVAADLAWNAVIEQMIVDAEKDVRLREEWGDKFMLHASSYHLTQLRNHLRPIAATEGRADE